jgi:hypothetical protein
MYFVNFILKEIKSKKLLISKFTGLFLILLTVNLNFGAHKPMSFPEYIKAWGIYDTNVKAGGKNIKVGITPLELMLVDLRVISVPNAGVLRFLAGKLALLDSAKEAVITGLEQRRLTANELIEDLLQIELFEKFGEASEAGGSGDGALDGGVSESKGKADGPSPDSSIGGVAESKSDDSGPDGVSPDTSAPGAASSHTAAGIRLDALAQKPKNMRETNFYLSLASDEHNWSPQYLKEVLLLPTGVPYLGHYTNELYYLRSILGMIKGTPELLRHMHIAPKSVIEHVSDISEHNLEFYIVLWGAFPDMSPYGYVSLPANSYNNVIFHPVLAKWKEAAWKAAGTWPMGAADIQGGLFMPDGVTTAGVGVAITFNSLGALNVNIHPGSGAAARDTFCSPNNAQFKLVDDRKLVSFWLVGKYNTHAVATLNLIINSGEASSGGDLGSKLMYAIDFSSNLDDLIKTFNRESNKAVRHAVRAVSADPNMDLDIETVWKFTDVLENMLKA